MIAYINGQFPAVRLSSSGGLQQVSDSNVQQLSVFIKHMSSYMYTLLSLVTL